jgi:hypothetical protein
LGFAGTPPPLCGAAVRSGDPRDDKIHQSGESSAMDTLAAFSMLFF